MTRPTSDPASASSPDGPVPKPLPAGDWPTRGSSLCPWTRPANAAGRRPCRPGDKPADRNTCGDNGCASRDRITRCSDSTGVVGWGSWAAPKRTAHVVARTVTTPVMLARRRPRRRRQVCAPREEDPIEEDHNFKPAGLPYSQNRGDKSQRRGSSPTLRSTPNCARDGHFRSLVGHFYKGQRNTTRADCTPRFV